MIFKWIAVIAALITLLIIMYLSGRKSVHSELVIETSPQEVWKVLMDIKGYPDWNRVLLPVSGSIEEGHVLPYQLIQPGGQALEIKLKVLRSMPAKLLNQYGGVPGLFTFDHRYMLEAEGEHTKVIIHEDFRGIGVLFYDVNWLDEAYTDLLRSLRDHILNSVPI